MRHTPYFSQTLVKDLPWQIELIHQWKEGPFKLNLSYFKWK